MQYGILVHFKLCTGVQKKAVADTLPLFFFASSLTFILFSSSLFYLRMGSGIESRGDNICWKKVLGSGSELGGVRVWRAGPFFIHTLELWFKRQIFIIFIVDYFYQNEFLKIKKNLVHGQSF